MKKDGTRKSEQTSVFELTRNSKCLCGSGDKFKRCCAGNLPGSDIGKRFQAVANSDDFNEVLIAARSDVTQYTIWHKTHTEPLLHVDGCEPAELFNTLIKVDVEALSDYVERLCRSYNRLNREDEVPALLERLRSNIDHPRWHRKISYLHVLHALGEGWDCEAGKKEFQKLGSMDEETDVEILQLYVNLFGEELNFSVCHALVERIAGLTEEPAERLHYQCLSAINLLMVGDQIGATKRLQSVINDYSDVRDEDKESAYALNFYALALDMLGQLRQDKPMSDKAAALFRQLVDRDDLTETGIANAYRNIGDVLRASSSWQEAKDAYTTAFEKEPHEVLKVFISQCLLYLKDLKSAKELIYTVEAAKLTTREAADYVFAFAQIAIESGEKEDLARAEQELRSLEIVEPYFKEHQNALLVSVLDTQRSGPSKERTSKLRTMLQKVPVLGRYFILEPNIMGIGLNVGKILEDVAGYKTASKKK